MFTRSKTTAVENVREMFLQCVSVRTGTHLGGVDEFLVLTHPIARIGPGVPGRKLYCTQPGRSTYLGRSAASHEVRTTDEDLALGTSRRGRTGIRLAESHEMAAILKALSKA